MRNKKLLKNLTISLLSVLTMLVIWSLSSAIINSEYILPSVWQTLVAMANLFGESKFYLALLMTLLRSLIAFAVSFTLGFALSLLAVKNDSVQRFIAPIISVMRALPTIAIVLLLLFWTKNSDVTSIVVTMLIVFPTVYTGLKNSLNSVDWQVVEMARAFNVSNKEIFKKIKLPSILPPTLSVIGSNLSLNLKLMVAAEVLSVAVRSLGNLLNHASYNGEISTMMGIVFVVVIIGVAIESVFEHLAKKVGAFND